MDGDAPGVIPPPEPMYSRCTPPCTGCSYCFGRTQFTAVGWKGNVVKKILRNMGDRALERLVPSTTASADVGYLKHCYCNGRMDYWKLCPFDGGACGPCRRTGEC